MGEPTKKDMIFANRLKKMRRRAEITQEELAVKTRLSTTFIGLLETGQRRPSFKSLQKLASALGIKAKDLIPY